MASAWGEEPHGPLMVAPQLRMQYEMGISHPLHKRSPGLVAFLYNYLNGTVFFTTASHLAVKFRTHLSDGPMVVYLILVNGNYNDR